MGASVKGAFRVVVAGLVVLCAGREALATPGNDDFANATLVTALSFTDSQSTVGATEEPGEPSPCGSIGSTTWYTYTPPADVTLRADTFGSDYDTVLAVYSGTSLGSLTLVFCDDDFYSFLQSGVSFDATGGTTYYFQVGGFGGDQGNSVFHLGPVVCGDGVLDGDEECDDGNTVNGDGCSDACTVESGYLCSDSPSVCTPTVCGDGVIQGSEACDDGNAVSGDGCSDTCTIEPGYSCAGAPSVCSSISFSQCPPIGADTGCKLLITVDPGSSFTVANDLSQPPFDGFEDTLIGVQNDSGQPLCSIALTSTSPVYGFDGDGICTVFPQPPGCPFGPTTYEGPGVTFAPVTPYVGTVFFTPCIPDGGSSYFGVEEDIPTASGISACDGNGSCTGPEDCSNCPLDCGPCCGDGTCDGAQGETCANCLADCGVCGGCGDGIVTGSESCDDGNTVSGDGCSATCTVEPGYSCTGAPSACEAICGDGIVTGSETCDDGNTVSGDGCSDTCETEPGYSCSGEPSTCGPVCGDGIVVAPETCDPPDASIDPVTGKAFCRPDCTSCGDGVVQTETGAEAETCDDGNTAEGCLHTGNPHACAANAVDGCQNNCTKPICCDPSWIRYTPAGGALRVHGQLMKFDTSAPTDVPFTLTLTDESGGIVYQAAVPAGALVAFPTHRYLYRNPDSIRTGGISYVRIVKITRRAGFRATIRGYGDLSRASAHMTTHLLLGTQEWTVAGTWTQARNGWRLAD